MSRLRSAYRRKAEVDASYQALALALAGPARDGQARLALGTHDGGLIRPDRRFRRGGRRSFDLGWRFTCSTASAPQSWSGFGLPATPRSTLIAYGAHWYPWYMRRLAERPANVVFALRQLVP